MPTRNINLTERYDAFLARQIEVGRFKNASEVVRAALHLLEYQEQVKEAKLEQLRRDAKAGQDAYDRGEYTPIPDDAALDQFFEGVAEETDKR